MESVRCALSNDTSFAFWVLLVIELQARMRMRYQWKAQIIARLPKLVAKIASYIFKRYDYVVVHINNSTFPKERK